MSHQLELLAPAGNMERLEMVLHYGADAVYLAGEKFGMRAAAGNFDSEELPKAVKMAHDKHADVHVTVNTIPHEGEVTGLPSYLSFLQECGVDALIVADLGVMALAKKHYISHCYERPSFENFPYNLYAMMHAQTPEELDGYIKESVTLLGNPEFVVLHSLKELKKTSFRFFA